MARPSMRYRRKEMSSIMKQWLKRIRFCVLLAVAVLALGGISAMASEDDNSLSSLGIITEGVTVSPEFSYNTWSYDVTVPAGTTELQLDPVPSSASATVTDISGTTLNEDGTGYVTITVQSGNGNSFTYELHVESDGSAAPAATEAVTEAVTETETEPPTETEAETEDPQYVRVDRNSLQEAENTITELKTEITQYRDNVNRLKIVMYVLIGVAVVLLFVVVNLLLRRKDMKAELNDYRSYGYSEDKLDRKEEKARQKAQKKAKKKQGGEEDFFDTPDQRQASGRTSGPSGAGAQSGAQGQIQSFYDLNPRQPAAPSYPGLDVQPQKSQKKGKKMPQYEQPQTQSQPQPRQGNGQAQVPAGSGQAPAQGGRGAKKGKQSDVEINMIDL